MKLKIFKPTEADSIILASKNPEYSSILVGCDTLGIKNGFLIQDKRRALYTGPTSSIEQLVDDYNLVEGSEFPIEGKIIIIESTTPQYENQKPKINTNTKEEMTYEGALIYRSQILVDINDPRGDIKLVADSTNINSKVEELSKSAAQSFN